MNRIHRIQQYEKKRKIRNLKVKTFLRYYGVSSLAVDWTAMAFMAYYLIFIFPATYMVNRWGLRWSNIIGCCVTCLGSWIKVLSVSPDRFWVTFIGQSLVASTQVDQISFISKTNNNVYSIYLVTCKNIYYITKSRFDLLKIKTGKSIFINIKAEKQENKIKTEKRNNNNNL